MGLFFADSPDNFLTMAEKQKIIFRELESIRATESDEHVPGYEFIKLYTGRTIGEEQIPYLKCLCMTVIQC